MIVKKKYYPPVLIVSCGIILFTFLLSFSVLSQDSFSSDNLTVWDSGRYVFLRWDSEISFPVWGYNIYRSDSYSKEWKKLNSTIFTESSFIDFVYSDELLYDGAITLYYEVVPVGRNGDEISQSLKADLVIYKSGFYQQKSLASSFNKNKIIYNKNLLNYKSMSKKQIQKFLEKYESFLANYSVRGKSAAKIIYEASQQYMINPKIILCTLQKEQALITSKNPTKNQLKLAMGWDVPNKYNSHTFKKQIKYGTRQFRLYYDNLSRYGWTVGERHAVLDGTVKPRNKATAGLYIYTPWIGEGGGGKTGVGGNYLFWDLWYNEFEF